MELEINLNKEAFLKDYEKNPSYKQAFDFKTKIFASMKSQRTSLVLLVRLTYQIVLIKQQVDETLDISGAVVIREGNPEAGYTSRGEEDVPAIFRPWLHYPGYPWYKKRMN